MLDYWIGAPGNCSPPARAANSALVIAYSRVLVVEAAPYHMVTTISREP